jgi:hypothetical protein
VDLWTTHTRPADLSTTIPASPTNPQGQQKQQASSQSPDEVKPTSHRMLDAHRNPVSQAIGQQAATPDHPGIPSGIIPESPGGFVGIRILASSQQV